MGANGQSNLWTSKKIPICAQTESESVEKARNANFAVKNSIPTCVEKLNAYRVEKTEKPNRGEDTKY